MSLLPIRRRPNREWNDLTQPLHRQLDRLFEDFFSGDSGLLATREGNWIPAMDIWETQDHLMAKIDLPGIDSKDVKVEVQGDLLAITGQKRSEEVTEKDNYHLTERSFGSFYRAFRLPSWANGDHVDANFKNGTLELKIPKKETARSKTVNIKEKS